MGEEVGEAPEPLRAKPQHHHEMAGYEDCRELERPVSTAFVGPTERELQRSIQDDQGDEQVHA